MPEEKRNIDSIIEGRIRRSLAVEVPGEFTGSLMKKIEAEQQFREEDRKTFNIAKTFTGIMAVLFIAFASVIGFWLAGNGAAENISDGIGSRLSFYFDTLGYKFIELTGFTGQMGYMILVAMAVIFLFTIAEKMLLRKHH